jgi:hypothetical protein
MKKYKLFIKNDSNETELFLKEEKIAKYKEAMEEKRKKRFEELK